jgi:hypothetical protein
MPAKNVDELLIELRARENTHTRMRMKQAWDAAMRDKYLPCSLRDSCKRIEKSCCCFGVPICHR